VKEIKASPPLHFIKPELNIRFTKFISFIFPIVQYFKTSIRRVDVEDIETLAEKYIDLQNGKARILIAFRHPNADDPLSLIQLFWRKLPKYFQEKKIKLDRFVHFHFVWDRGIPLWAGNAVAKLYSKLGGIPIHRGKVDWKGLNTIRETFVNSPYPILIAPEGATNGHIEILSPLEPGLAQLAVWCLEDLKKQNRNELVYIIPMGIKYKFKNENWEGLNKILISFKEILGKDFLENETVPNDNLSLMNEAQRISYTRLMQVFNSILTLLENYFQTYFFKQKQVVDSFNIEKRIQFLAENVLSVEENFFGLKARGSIIDRCRKLEQASWDWIYREDYFSEKSLPLQSLENRIAFDAKRQDWNMRLIESLVAIQNNYIPTKPSFERFMDVTLLLHDTLTKIITGSGQKRPIVENLDSTIRFGKPILVNDYIEEINSSRIGAKSAMSKITIELTQRLNDLMI
jgi:1-acyl-sn-glycerol-3-phosphate acyltransferase